MKYYKDHYDVIVIGGALAGLSSALMLADNGKDVLVLEQHNLPGGVASSFVRGGVEVEAALHEMMSIGEKNNRLKVGKFFDDMGVDIDWLKVPEAYRAAIPDLDVTLHPGFERFAKEVDTAVPGSYDKVYKLLQLCHTVYDSVNVLSVTPMSKLKMLKEHEAFVKTAGYTAKEVMDSMEMPQKAVDLMAPYWIYVGSALSELPFTVYAVLMADYIGYGSYVPRKLSHEMSLKMAERAEEMGVQIEYKQRVDKILVKDGKVYGVRTARGDEIHSDYVISAAYPNKVYTQMIEPLSEVPAEAIKMVNGRRISLTNITVIMLLDKSAEELGIEDYSLFWGKTMDTDKIFENFKTVGPYDYLTCICLNNANPDASPEGTCFFSITVLPDPEGWMKVKAEDYLDVKRECVKDMIEKIGDFYGINFFDHIKELIIETPMTMARFCGTWNGSVYGYSHTQKDNIVARLQTADKEHFFEGLEFAGAHQISGDGMGPQVTNGRKAAKNVLDAMEAKGKEA